MEVRTLLTVHQPSTIFWRAKNAQRHLEPLGAELVATTPSGTHHAPSNWPGPFFAARSWAGCTTNMFGFDLRQAQA
jgi:hypothetical protein